MRAMAWFLPHVWPVDAQIAECFVECDALRRQHQRRAVREGAITAPVFLRVSLDLRGNQPVYHYKNTAAIIQRFYLMIFSGLRPRIERQHAVRQGHMLHLT